MSEWQPIDTAPRDGTVIDLWMVDEDGGAYRVADAYYVTGLSDEEFRYTTSGELTSKRTTRDGWYAPNYGYGGDAGFCDEPRWFNCHPMQNKWAGCSPTHWLPLPPPPTPTGEK